MAFHEPSTPGPGPVRKLHRSRTQRQLAGVCGGIAEYTNTDPTVIRVIFIVLGVLGGSTLVIYPILWLLVPEAPAYPGPDGPGGPGWSPPPPPTSPIQ